MCVLINRLCDGVQDCPDASDEDATRCGKWYVSGDEDVNDDVSDEDDDNVSGAAADDDDDDIISNVREEVTGDDITNDNVPSHSC